MSFITFSKNMVTVLPGNALLVLLITSPCIWIRRQLNTGFWSGNLRERDHSFLLEAERTPEPLNADRRKRSLENFQEPLPGIETGTSRLAAQCLNKLCHPPPQIKYIQFNQNDCGLYLQMNTNFINKERYTKFKVSVWIHSDWQKKCRSTKDKLEKNSTVKKHRVWNGYEWWKNPFLIRENKFFKYFEVLIFICLDFLVYSSTYPIWDCMISNRAYILVSLHTQSP